MKLLVPVALAFVLMGAAVASAAEPPGADVVDQAFEKLKKHDYDQPRQPLAVLELFVARATKDAQASRRRRRADDGNDDWHRHPARTQRHEQRRGQRRR